MKIQAIFFDIGGTIHVQDATPEQDVRYANLVHELLEEHGIEAGTAHDLLQKIDCGAKKYKKTNCLRDDYNRRRKAIFVYY